MASIRATVKTFQNRRVDLASRRATATLERLPQRGAIWGSRKELRVPGTTPEDAEILSWQWTGQAWILSQGGLAARWGTGEGHQIPASG